MSGAPQGGRIAAIQRAVSEAYGLPREAMTSPRRARAWAQPRQIAMYLAKRLCPETTLMEIGGSFERDHTTVMNAADVIARRRAADPAFAAQVDALERALSQRLASIAGLPAAEKAARKFADIVVRALRQRIEDGALEDPHAFLAALLKPPPAKMHANDVKPVAGWTGARPMVPARFSVPDHLRRAQPSPAPASIPKKVPADPRSLAAIGVELQATRLAVAARARARDIAAEAKLRRAR
ncbi:MAG: hypothetical protein NBV67_00915 [Tagaea sp.]|nr:hypothetical protein [Tagaea sp.]